MAYMRTNLVFGLFWLNLIVFALNIVFYVKGNNRSYYDYSDYPPYNLISSPEKNQNYFLENVNETPKMLRILYEAVDPIILYINLSSILFLILIFLSFWVTRNECCSSDAHINSDFPIGSCCGACMCCDRCVLNEDTSFKSCLDCRCQSTGSSDACGECIGMILIIVVSAIFLLFAFIFTKILVACGKNLIRAVSFSALTLIELAIAIMAVRTSSGTFMILITVFSSISAISNILGLLLPNLGCFGNLSYVDYPKNQMIAPDVLNPSNPSSQPFVPPSVNNNLPNVIQYPIDQTMDTNYNMTNLGYNDTYGAPPSIYPQQNY